MYLENYFRTMAQVATSPPTVDLNSKLLFDEFRIFKNHCNRISAASLKIATQQHRSTIYYYGQEDKQELIVTNNHQPNIETDTIDTHFNLFEAHIHPIVQGGKT